MSKIIDCFPFFNEKELLELRINLLKNYVDEFFILEANKTHSGNNKSFLSKKIIEEFNLPKEKINIIEVIIPEDKDIIPEESDYIYSREAKSENVKNWSRERIQRDALTPYLKYYSDDTVFILSDCDEIIDPKYLSYFSQICKNYSNNYIKVPLVSLEGRADKRLYKDDCPYDWDRSMVLCTKKHLSNNGSPTKFRGEYNTPISPVWITENNTIIKDCGWHFTWMGDKDNRLLKSQNTIHSDNLSVYNNLSSGSMHDICNHNNQFILKEYPIEKLPSIIFTLSRVKDFLLPNDDISNIKNEIHELYTRYDKNMGVWGWCPKEKADKIIDCVIETCRNIENPVCVEIGVYAGKSLFPFGLCFKYLNKGKVYAIDPWLNSEATIGYEGKHYDFWNNIPFDRVYNTFLMGLNELNIEKFVEIIKDASDNVDPIHNISVLHIDGQHTDQVIKDINKYATAVILNGYCFLDDVYVDGWPLPSDKAIQIIESFGFVKVDQIEGCCLYKRVNI